MKLLSEAGSGQTLSALARELGVGKSSLLGILRALEDAGWLRREGNDWSLGHGFISLARKVSDEPDAVAIARPHLKALAEKLKVSVCLGARNGDTVVIEACEEAEGGLRIALKPGMRVPLLAAATGKAFFSAIPESEWQNLLTTRLPRFTANSIQTPEEYIAAARKARENGYATDDEEYLRGVRAVAAPVSETGAWLLWAVGFADNFSDAKMREAGTSLAATAKKIYSLLKNPSN